MKISLSQNYVDSSSILTAMQVTWCQSSLEEVFREVSLDDDGYSNEKTDTETEEEEEEDRGGVRKGRKRS